VRFPVTITHRTGKVKIYAPANNFTYYRLSFTQAGKRQMQTFATYSEAKAAGEVKAKEIHNNPAAASLTPSQARDALAAFQRLESFRLATGRTISLLASVSEHVESLGKLKGRSLDEAISGFLRIVVSVKRKDVRAAVDEFILAEEPRTKAVNGQRAQLSPKYAYTRAIRLRKFADTFPGTSVSDLSKEHLDTFIGSLDKLKTKTGKGRAVGSAKSRNHYRAVVQQFLQWAVRKDYLAPTHRLNEADAMRPEHANTAEVEFYTPGEFAALLENAEETLRPVIAIGGLAGLRSAELLRLDWADVWRVAGHIEITAGKSKTRQRRLVEICPALGAWLEPYRQQKTGKFWPGEERTYLEHYGELCETAEITRKANGLRHSFCSFHFALHANENQTAQQAGNSPAMIHAHYKGLATKADAEKWFNVMPSGTAKKVISLAAASHKKAR
jgi:integrase